MPKLCFADEKSRRSGERLCYHVESCKTGSVRLAGIWTGTEWKIRYFALTSGCIFKWPTGQVAVCQVCETGCCGLAVWYPSYSLNTQLWLKVIKSKRLFCGLIEAFMWSKMYMRSINYQSLNSICVALAMLFISWCGLFRETKFDTCALTVWFFFFNLINLFLKPKKESWLFAS